MKIIIILALLANFIGCSSKKTTTKTGADVDINAEVMSFDPQGSDSGKVPGLYTIHFDFDKYALSKDAKENLNKNAEWLKNHPSIKLQIEGHCDQRGSAEYNLALGERRAKASYDYLVKTGANKEQISIISYGKEKPISTSDSDKAQAKNRRDNFVPIK